MLIEISRFFFDFNHEDIVFSAFTIHIRIQLNELHRTVYRKRKTKSARILRFLNLTFRSNEWKKYIHLPIYIYFSR